MTTLARQLKHEQHAARRREILDAALQVMEAKGYERMTIQDVLVALEMSKGALYHYFESKQALLEGIVDSMTESGARALRAVVDTDMGAIEKMHAYFAASRTWKAENATAVSMAMRLWRHENNALLRQKLAKETRHTSTPLLESIIRQGCHEGVFDTDHPHEAAIVLTGMDLQVADAIIDAIDADGSVGADTSGPHARAVMAAYIQAFERILGAPAGSLAPAIAEPVVR